jgi:perosamine synthetase
MSSDPQALASTILERIRTVVGPSSRESMVALHEPDFSDTRAAELVQDCISTGWVSSAGRWVEVFERELAAATGASYVVAVANGTVALRLALHLVGVGAGDEVLMPPISFVATANAASHLGAIPHFVDIERESLGLSPQVLQNRLEELAERRGSTLINRHSGRRIAAILPVHVFGMPAAVEPILAIARDWDLPVIEDAAEALGSWRGRTHCGLFGSVGTLSFNGNKLITTGGGGALLTHDEALARRARHLSTTAKLPHPWEFRHDAIGWNDRMPNLNAALGVAQLEVLVNRLERKRLLQQRYREALGDLQGVELLEAPAGCRVNHWLATLRFTTSDAALASRQRLALLEQAHAEGLLLRPVWQPLSTLPMYREAPASCLDQAFDSAERLINLPSSPQLLNSHG